MEDEERQKKLEAGKAKLAEYRQRKAHADSQKKQKKKKKKKSAEDSDGDTRGLLEAELDRPAGGEETSGDARDDARTEGGPEEPPTTQFTFSRTLRTGETVQHDQTYTIEPESEVSTTAEDYSSEDEEALHQVKKGGAIHTMEDALAAKTQEVAELNQELEEIRAAFGSEGVQQLADFEAALKQRDGIITQLTTNLQQAREEKDEIMKEFLELTEQSQKLQIQFQQLQAGETLRNTSHSSTAADLLQARQQLSHYQQQVEELNAQAKQHQEKQLEHISQLQHKLTETELSWRRSDESSLQRINEKDLLIADKDKVIFSQEQSLAELRAAEESYAQTVKEKDQFISEQTSIIKEHKLSLTQLREELVHVGQTADKSIMQQLHEKDTVIAERVRVISERNCSIAQLEDALKSSEESLRDLQRQMTVQESERGKLLNELDSSKSELEVSKSEMESYKLELDKERRELETCKGELTASRQKEQMSSGEIKQLMGVVEDLQKRVHQGSLTESDSVQKLQEENGRQLDRLRAELDEMYGEQIVQMKEEINAQHAAGVERLSAEHRAELQRLKAQLSESSAASAGEVTDLQGTLEKSQAMLGQVTQEKLDLQAEVERLLQDLRSAEDKVEQVSRSVTSQERHQEELRRLQEVIDGLQGDLADAHERAEEAEAKHDSEITNYKIKLDMLEREKDAVLDRMAESQEAELERLRTQLLFSHEEELTSLREELQRENFLNTENLLNEASVRHQRAMDELGARGEEKLRALQREKAGFAAERDELVHQIVGLKEDLKLALHSSKADELVQQLQELQVELDELKREGNERARLESELQKLAKKTEALEKQSGEKEQYWRNKCGEHSRESEKLMESHGCLKEELDSKTAQIETLAAESERRRRQVAELTEEVEKQRTTFSFAERNFEVNYQELKAEYASLAEARALLEERLAAEALAFEARIRELEAERFSVPARESESLAGGIQEHLEAELRQARRENAQVIARSESLSRELEETREIMGERATGQGAQGRTQQQQQQQADDEFQSSAEDHQLQLQSLQEEIKNLRSLLHAAESERDDVRRLLELQGFSPSQSSAAAEARSSKEEGPVEGRFSPQKSTASGSNRRKRRQRSKQERKLASVQSDCREQEREEEEEEEAAATAAAAAVAAVTVEEEEEEEQERATSAAELKLQPQMESRLMSRSAERAGEEDSADGCQGDGGGENRGGINKQPREDATRHLTATEETDTDTGEHAECRLQVEAQHLSLTQIHAAQLELVQEGAEARAHRQEPRNRTEQDEPKRIQFNSIGQAVTEECNEIIQGFKRLFGEEFFECVDAEGRPSLSADQTDTVDSSAAVLKARDLYRDLQQLRETIVQEHLRLSALQSLLRTDGNKMMELQTAYDELKSDSERKISDLRVHVTSADPSAHIDADERSSGRLSTSLMEELRTLRAQDQQKQLWLEERHRQEVERLRAHYQQRATETEERYLTELFMLQQRLQEVTGTETHFSVSEFPCENIEEQLLKELSEGEPSARGAESPTRSAGLTAQLQALRKALYHKYVQEVAALKEQHDRELRTLRDESEPRGGRDSNGELDAGRPAPSGSEGRRFDLERTQERENLEEEVAKAVVQMSVQFAQQTELARLNKRALQRCTSMQTQSSEEEAEERAERESEEPTPRASPTSHSGLEGAERERYQRELDDRAAEISTLKEELKRSMFAPKQTVKKQEGSQEGAEDEEERGGKRKKQGPVSPQEDERNAALLASNQNLRQALAEVLKTTAAAEETLVLHMQSLSASDEGDNQRAAWEQTNVEPLGSHPAGSSESGPQNAASWSDETKPDKNSDVSWQVIESWLMGAGTQPENEDYLLGISGRLQAALEKMLMAITDTTNQLEHAEMTQTELMRESFRHNQEINELLQKQEELQERLAEEARAREQLALELHRAEGLIDGYTGERAALEEQLRQKEELHLILEQELQVTSSRLQELEQDRLQMQEERELLSRQQDAMREDAGPRELRLVEAAMVAAPEADLLEETEKLMKEKVEVQRQAEKENADLLKHVKLLETELEEQVNRAIELEQAHKLERGDLQQQVQALEKQLEKNRKFLDEQAVDREHERDFFQQEIHKLEQQLKNPQKLQTSAEQRNQEVDRGTVKVEQLTSQLKEKADWCSELLLSTEQRCRELQERDEEIDKLESRIRELEQALLASAESLEKVEQKKQHASVTESKQSTLETQLQTEREALERKEKEICNLEEQLEQFREELENKSEEVQQLHMQLEIQRKEIISQQDYLETRDGMLQVMEAKDREIALLNEQITRLQHMETASDNKALDVRNELIKDLESQVECLRSEQERLRKNNEEELEQLNSVIDKLQQDLANIEQKQTAEDGRPESESSSVCGPSQEEYEEVQQRAEAVGKQLDAVKAERDRLLETHQRLKESAEASAESRNSEAQLEEVLRQKTAGLVVMQAQVQALEQSATSRVEELDRRIRELEEALEEKDGELGRCRLLVEQTQSHAEGLEKKVFGLEKNLREKMAAVLVTQATLEAFQQQQPPQTPTEQQEAPAEPRSQPRSPPPTYDVGDFSIPKIDFGEVGQTRHDPPTRKVFHLTQRLRELEVGLSGMQKDQELQKHLLSSSEEEVLEYERTLTVLMDLLNQMKSTTGQRASAADKASPAEAQPAASELLEELQHVRDEVSSTKEQLSGYADSCSRLQEELKDKTVTIERLQEQLHKGMSGDAGEAQTVQLREQLTEAQNEASATKEELNCCKESLEKLQELLQEREMTIAQLKAELFEVKADEDRADAAALLQETKDEASSTKKELDGYRQRNDKLQSDLLSSEGSVSKLREQLLEMKRSGDSAKEELNSSLQSADKLQQDVHDRDGTISELREELQSARQSLDAVQQELSHSAQRAEELGEDRRACEVMVTKVQEELQDMRQAVDASRKELDVCKQQNEKLKEELQARELSVSKLREELQEAQKASPKRAESGPPSPSPSPSPVTSPQPPVPSAAKRKGGKQASGKGGSSAKDKPSLNRKAAAAAAAASSSRSHCSRAASSSSDTHEAAVAHVSTQTEQAADGDPQAESRGDGNDEMEEVIGEFQQKIVQMRELHAAEILDMEARHISESEGLRRDTQALEDECKALKAVVDKLRSSEVHSLRQDRLASQFRDGYTSDSSSDYSQRTSLDIPGLQQEIRATPEGARREADDALPDKIKSLLREVHQEGMQVLSLSELPLLEGEPGGQTSFQSWAKERSDLLATVESLKRLITQMQTQRETQTSGSEDWRAELLEAVRQVFARERSLLKSALYSQLDLLDTNDAIVHLNQLESRLVEQDIQHQEAMGLLRTADRSSLVSEVRQLRGQLLHLSEAQPSERNEGGGGADGAAAAAAATATATAAAAAAAATAALRPSDRLLVEELKVELSQTKLELETTLKAQHKHLKELDTLRVEVSQKAAEADELNDQLTEERKRSRDLQWAVEKERCRTGRDEERKREELEDLQLSLEEQRSRVAQLTLTLEEERHASSQLSERAEQERLALHRHLQELRVQLETEQAKTLEVSAALGREKEGRSGAFPPERHRPSDVQEEDEGRLEEEEESRMERLQKELDHKHTQVVDLLGQVEAQRLEVVRKEEELTLGAQRTRREQEALQEAQAQLKGLKARMQEVQEQLGRETERGKVLEEEKERLEERISQLAGREGGGGGKESDSAAASAWHGRSAERTKDWVFKQEVPPTGALQHHGPWRTVDKILGKLHLVSSKVRSMAGKTAGRQTAEVNSEELSWVQSSVDEVIAMLQQSPGLPSVPESVSLLAGSSSNTLTERLLKQNAELTGFVSRLTEEKNDLRNHTLRLEEEVRRYRQAAPGAGDGFGGSSSRWGAASKADASGLMFSQEREAWTRERTRLEKALHQAQAQLARLRGEIRAETVREVTGPEADNAALKRMYGKYLRSESFRKALVYQKKYLLLLLGGFQECEEATLSLLSRMGGAPSPSSAESFGQRRRGLTRFRSAVRVSIALSRMRFLVKRWHKATGLSTTTSCVIGKNGVGQSLGTEARDSPYLHPGSVEVYRERGGGVSGNRGRSGRESPRSAVSSSHHRFHGAGDHGGLTCSHLQSYDPDRALTDYISRLEALQRRLGSVTSGASSYAQLHFGLRR